MTTVEHPPQPVVPGHEPTDVELKRVENHVETIKGIIENFGGVKFLRFDNHLRYPLIAIPADDTSVVDELTENRVVVGDPSIVPPSISWQEKHQLAPNHLNGQDAVDADNHRIYPVTELLPSE